MTAIVIVLALTCAWIVCGPMLHVEHPSPSGACVYLDRTTTPPSWRIDPDCVESESSNAS